MEGKKSKSKTQEDYISLLSDCLLIDIITRLPETEEAIRTGTLSKRWQHLWLQVPNLIYRYDVEYDHRVGRYADRIAKFFSFFEKTLTQRGESNINKFKLHCTYSVDTESQLSNCIRYAISNNVKAFDIKVWDYDYRCRVDLPQTFFTSSSFVHLKLSEYYMATNKTGVISWKNLRTLCLKRVFFEDGFIENILSGSPLLETLKLADCVGPERLHITNKSVKTLVLSFSFKEHGERMYSFEVYAPYILSLTIQNYCTLEKLLLLNVSSVIKAELNYFNTLEPRSYDPFDEPDPEEPYEEMLRRLILSLGHVKEIKIGRLCVETLALLQDRGFIFPSNLKIY